MAKDETRLLTAHLPIPLAYKVDQLADHLERSRDWIVKQALCLDCPGGRTQPANARSIG